MTTNISNNATHSSTDTDNSHIIIYTDGSCSPNPGSGGWSAIIRRVIPDTQGDADITVKEREFSGGVADTTNNRMELTAVIQGFRELGTRKFHEPVTVFTDSTYVKDGITKWLFNWKANGWRKSDGGSVVNRDLWEQLEEIIKTRKVTFEWVRGHNNDEYNEKADTLARAAAEGALKKAGR